MDQERNIKIVVENKKVAQWRLFYFIGLFIINCIVKNVFLWYNIIDKNLKGAETSWLLHYGWKKFQKQ